MSLITPVPPGTHFQNSAATTNPVSVKQRAGRVHSVWASNSGAATRYLKLYNKASAPTVGTDVPVVVVPIAAGGAVNQDLADNGFSFPLGIAYAITANMPDADATAIGANEVKLAISYR